MDRLSWTAFSGGQAFVWWPLPGLDGGVGEQAMWVGAARWAAARAAGKPESVAHIEAEKAVYEAHYRVKY
jgi:hypothetical protein